jgi:hypothetical protein
MTAEERSARLGHPGHLRSYGPDIVDRLAAAGFRAKIVWEKELEDDIRRRTSIRDESLIIAARGR